MTSFVGGNAFILSTSPPTINIPSPALASGYTMNTFNSTKLNNTIGNLYYPSAFGGYTYPALGQTGAVAQQNGDGSFTLLGSSAAVPYSAVSTAQYSAASTGQFVGTAFGGGCYVEAAMGWNPGTGASAAVMPQISFTDIETLAYNGVVTTVTVWPGLQATLTAGSSNITLNFPTASNYAVGNTIIFTALTAPILTEQSASDILTRSGSAILATIAGTTGTVTGIALNTNYYIVSVGTSSVQVSATLGGAAITLGGTGTVNVGLSFSEYIELLTKYATGATTQLQYSIGNFYGGSVVKLVAPINVIMGSNTFANQNNFGMLWIPATATTAGSITWYFNDVATVTQSYNQYSAMLQPPPVLNTSAFSVLDTRHIAVSFATSTTYPMTVSSLNVWQASSANNLVHPA